MDAQHREPRQPLVLPGQIDHHVADMTATFSADVTLADAQARLAQSNQWLPIDGDPAHELGLLVERNSTGPLRLGYGAWRDLLLGCQFLNGRNELITAGGRTMKNVAGYDLTKLMVGQHGIFGRIVTITARAYRRPDAALVARFAPDLRNLNQLLVTPERPQWAVLTREVLHCGYVGDQRTIGYFESQVPRHNPIDVRRRTLDEDVAHRVQLWSAEASGAMRFRAALPPSRIVEFTRSAHLTAWSADAAFGVVIGACEPARRTVVVTATDSVGGSVQFLDDRGRPTNLATAPDVVALLQRLKSAFDPHDTLRPLPVAVTQ